MSIRNRRPRGSPRLEALEARDVPAVIGGVVYHDLNANGLLDGNDQQGLGGITMHLRDEAGGLVATTTTASDGRYVFAQRDNIGSQPGVSSYEAVFSASPTDISRSGSIAQFDPALGTLTSIELVAEGSLNAQAKLENLGNHQAAVEAKLKGMLSFQVQGVGQAFTSNVERKVQGTLGAFDGNADLSGTSAMDSGQVQMAGQFQSLSITDQAQMQAFLGTGSLQVSHQASGESQTNGPGNLLSMINTTAQGKVKVVYRYTPSNEIGPGKYTVVEVNQPGGFKDGRETKDNTTAITGSERTDVIEVGIVSRTEQKTTNHFGEVKEASISGRVYHDVNRSGSLDAGDRGIGNVTVRLIGVDVFGNDVTRITHTLAGGFYSFTNLLPGTYQVAETQPAGYQQGTNTVGSLNGTVDGDNFKGVVVASGQEGVDYNFGETRTSVIPPPPIVIPPPLRPPVFGKFLFFGRMW